jgi:hypothetical protein
LALVVGILFVVDPEVPAEPITSGFVRRCGCDLPPHRSFHNHAGAPNAGDDVTDDQLETASRLARQLRVDSIGCGTRAGSGHPTSSLSAADLIAVLVCCHLQYDWDRPKLAANDHLIFSKCHASPLLYFGTLSHSTLVNLVAARVANGKVLGLVRQFLEAGVLRDGRFEPTTTGVPQGGVATPPTQWITGAQKGVVSHGDGVADDDAFGSDEDFFDHAS